MTLDNELVETIIKDYIELNQKCDKAITKIKRRKKVKKITTEAK